MPIPWPKNIYRTPMVLLAKVAFSSLETVPPTPYPYLLLSWTSPSKRQACRPHAPRGWPAEEIRTKSTWFSREIRRLEKQSPEKSKPRAYFWLWFPKLDRVKSSWSKEWKMWKSQLELTKDEKSRLEERGRRQRSQEVDSELSKIEVDSDSSKVQNLRMILCQQKSEIQLILGQWRSCSSWISETRLTVSPRPAVENEALEPAKDWSQQKFHEVKRFMKSAFLVKNPARRYSFTWTKPIWRGFWRFWSCWESHEFGGQWRIEISEWISVLTTIFECLCKLWTRCCLFWSFGGILWRHRSSISIGAFFSSGLTWSCWVKWLNWSIEATAWREFQIPASEDRHNLTLKCGFASTADSTLSWISDAEPAEVDWICWFWLNLESTQLTNLLQLLSERFSWFLTTIDFWFPPPQLTSSVKLVASLDFVDFV